MTLIDTSTLVAWLDAGHPDHRPASEAVVEALANEHLENSVFPFPTSSSGPRPQSADGNT